MRPDEHKKKKNALYKKKHGIQTDQKRDNNEEGSGRSARPAADAASAKPPERRGPLDSLSVEKVTATVDDQPSDEQVHHKVYQKRKVESNWQRYEEEPSDDTQRGADFNELLQSSTHLKPQFQFSAMHSVLAGTNVDSVAAGNQASFLSFDCERLAASLRSIPLHERLNIDESVFEKTHLESLVKESEILRAALNKTEVTGSPSVPASAT